MLVRSSDAVALGSGGRVPVAAFTMTIRYMEDYFMTEVDHYSEGVPCWVDTWQQDPKAARAFYGQLFGWRYSAVPLAAGGTYANASLDGQLVAGIGQALAGAPAVWAMSIRVAETARVIEAVERAGGRTLAPPLELGDQGRMAVIADATGVAFVTWETGQRTGAELAGAPNSWAMSSLHTADLEESERFYGAVFGWALVRQAGTPLCEWRLGGERIAVATPTNGSGVPAHWATNFAVVDADACAARAAALGATLLMAPADTPGFRNAVIADPQGGVFSVSAARA